jgi:two-component system, chemotaxis family, CheB/CheR fusion protein
MGSGQRAAGANAVCALPIRDCARPRPFEPDHEASRILAAIVESSDDAIIGRDLDGIILTWNRGAERMFGYRAAEVVGRPISLLIPEDHADELATVLDAIRAGRHIEHFETTRLTSDGRRIDVSLSISPIRDEKGRLVGAAAILRDITARKHAEAALRKSEALAKMGEMAAIIAHEVKNPLAAIRGAIQIIGGRLPAGSKDAAVASEVIARIDALDRLVRDLLLLSRPSHARLERIDFSTMVLETVDLMKADPAARGVHVQLVACVERVFVDPALLKIVLLNLMLNAAHAMEGRGTLRIISGLEDERLRIDVIDSGPGIPPDVRAQLFTPFFTTKARGTGLGLPIAKRLIEAHQGTIRVTCPADRGTVITIEIPQSVQPS